MIEATLEHAGFINASVVGPRVDLAYRNKVEAIGAALVGGPVALPYDRFGDDERQNVEREYLDSDRN